jgi:cystathionine beta-synthase
MWHQSILDTIGETPLVKINSITSTYDVTVLAKLEMFNPGASVKDRIGLEMILQSERDGKLRPGGTIIEGTSGNTGAGLALVAISRGYKCIFTTTDKQSPEKADVLRAYGAEVRVCPTNVAPDDPRSYYSVARRLHEEIPNSVYLNQYDNPANAEAHYASTGPELWKQTDGRITHFIASAGTGGTISGTGRYLKEKNPDIKVVGVDPFGSVYFKYFHTGEFDETEIYPYVTEGAGEDILAKNMDFGLLDDFVRSTDADNMIMTRRLAREEGLFVGQSSGMVMCGALAWLEDHRDELKPEDVVVVLFPDTGFRYLSKTYNDVWMREHGFLEGTPVLRVSDILQARGDGEVLIGLDADDTLGSAVDRMTQHGYSQLPVFKDGVPVGSVTESDVLNRLISDPSSRSELVENVMGDALPLVARDIPVQQLTPYLGTSPGAVLVRNETDSTYEILTKSDLIGTLSGHVFSNRNEV